MIQEWSSGYSGADNWWPSLGKIFIFFKFLDDFLRGVEVISTSEEEEEEEEWWWRQRSVAMDLTMRSNIIFFTNFLFGGIKPPFFGLNHGSTSAPTIFSSMFSSISKALSLYVCGLRVLWSELVRALKLLKTKGYQVKRKLENESTTT